MMILVNPVVNRVSQRECQATETMCHGPLSPGYPRLGNGTDCVKLGWVAEWFG